MMIVRGISWAVLATIFSLQAHAAETRTAFSSRVAKDCSPPAADCVLSFTKMRAKERTEILQISCLDQFLSASTEVKSIALRTYESNQVKSLYFFNPNRSGSVGGTLFNWSFNQHVFIHVGPNQYAHLTTYLDQAASSRTFSCSISGYKYVTN